MRPSNVPAEFITLDGGMQYRLVPWPLVPTYKLAIVSRIPTGFFSTYSDFMGGSTLEKYRMYKLFDFRDGLAEYREMECEDV